MAKEFVIDSEVIDDHSAFGDPGRPAGFEDIGRFAGEAFGDPAFDRSATQQFVLENREFFQVIKCLDFFERIEPEFGFFAQPEGGPGRFVEVPLDGLVGVLIKFFLGFGDIGRIGEPSR